MPRGRGRNTAPRTREGGWCPCQHAAPAGRAGHKSPSSSSHLPFFCPRLPPAKPETEGEGPWRSAPGSGRGVPVEDSTLFSHVLQSQADLSSNPALPLRELLQRPQTQFPHL